MSEPVGVVRCKACGAAEPTAEHLKYQHPAEDWTTPCITMRSDLLSNGVRYSVLQHGHTLWEKTVNFKPGHSFYSPGGLAFRAAALEQERRARKYLEAHRCLAEVTRA